MKTRKKREKTGGKWARYGLKRVNTGSGDVDATEVIAVFYRRYGKAGALKKLDMLVEQQALEQTITFTDFLQADNKMREAARRGVAKSRRRAVEPPTRHDCVRRPV